MSCWTKVGSVEYSHSRFVFTERKNDKREIRGACAENALKQKIGTSTSDNK